MLIRIQVEDFNLTNEVAKLRAGKAQIGAVVSFIGTVRDMNEGVSVSELELEHYPGMTEKSLKDIVLSARNIWDFVDATVIHRVGTLKPMDQIVLVAVASSHRKEAFEACEYIMDYLKTSAPFWKKEQTPEGTRWVDARASDDDAMAYWSVGEQK